MMSNFLKLIHTNNLTYRVQNDDSANLTNRKLNATLSAAHFNNYFKPSVWFLDSTTGLSFPLLAQLTVRR